MLGADRSTGPILGTYSIWVQHFEVTFFSANEARHDVVDVIEDDDDDPSRALPQLFFKNYFSSSSTGGAAAAAVRSLTSDTQIFFLLFAHYLDHLSTYCLRHLSSPFEIFKV